MPKKPFTVQLDTKVISNLESVAGGCHLEDTKYATLVLNALSELRPEYALHALTAIPKEYFRAKPGRPPSASSVERPPELALR
jgi:hypothetical protein